MRIVAVILVLAMAAAFALLVIRRRRRVVELEERTKQELYEQAQEAGIEGRSQMTKAELAESLADQERPDE